MTRRELTTILDDAPVFRDHETGDVAIALPAVVVGLLLVRHGTRRPIPTGFVVSFDRDEAKRYARDGYGDWRRELVARKLLTEHDYEQAMTQAAAARQRDLAAPLPA